MKIETGQVAVVTGAASGIGLALVQAFVGRGLSVAMLDVDEKLLEREAKNIAEHGGDVQTIQCDVRTLAALEHARDQVLKRFGRIDIVCNNAGVVLPFGPLWKTDLDGWKWIVEVNLDGVFNGIRAFVPLLVDQGHGYVVNTASMAGVAIIPTNGAYNATKHAVVSLTETLQADLAQAGSKVGTTVLCCGLVRTHIQAGGRTRPDGELVKSERPALSAEASQALEPMDVALQVLSAIEEEKLHLFTNPGSEQRIRARIDRLLADL